MLSNTVWRHTYWTMSKSFQLNDLRTLERPLGGMCRNQWADWIVCGTQNKQRMYQRIALTQVLRATVTSGATIHDSLISGPFHEMTQKWATAATSQCGPFLASLLAYLWSWLLRRRSFAGRPFNFSWDRFGVHLVPDTVASYSEEAIEEMKMLVSRELKEESDETNTLAFGAT